MKTATSLLLATLACAAAQQPAPATTMEYESSMQFEVAFAMPADGAMPDWQTVDNLFAAVLAAQSPDDSSQDFTATIVFATGEYEQPPPPPQMQQPEPGQQQQQDAFEIVEAAVAPQEAAPGLSEPEAEEAMEAMEAAAQEQKQEAISGACRSAIEAVDAFCEPDLCSDDCRGAASAAVAMLPLCKALPVGLAYSSCGVHAQSFGMELEIVARAHDCKCAGTCPPQGVQNPYCDDVNATLDEAMYAQHRVPRSALLLASFLYFMIWMSVWRRYVACVEGRYIAAGRPMGRCHRTVFRIMALPLSACLTQFGLCMLAMMPSMLFVILLLLVVVRRRRFRAAYAQRAAVLAQTAQTELVVVQVSAPADDVVKAEEDCQPVVVGEVVDDDEVVDGAECEVLVGEVVADATLVEDKDDAVVVADVVA